MMKRWEGEEGFVMGGVVDRARVVSVAGIAPAENVVHQLKVGKRREERFRSNIANICRG